MKKIIVIFFIILGYVFYARFVLSPQPYKNFSLIDDGQNIEYSYHFSNCLFKRNCEGLKTEVFINEGGRSRIAYWLFQSFLYQGPLINAQLQHLIRIYGFGLIMVMLFLFIAVKLKVSLLATILGITIFVTNYSFSENIIRLGTLEPYQVIFLALFSIVFLNSDSIKKRNKIFFYIISIFLLSLLFLVRETSIAVFPVIILICLIFRKSKSVKDCLIILGLPTIFFLLAKKLLAGSGIGSVYVSDYNLNPLFIFQNAKSFINILMISTSPFIKISFVVTLLGLFFPKTRKLILSEDILYWLFMFIAFTVIYFPWKYVLDRYLLISFFCFSVFVSLLFSRILSVFEENLLVKKYLGIYYVLVFLIFSNLFFRGFPINFARTINYRNWFLTFTQFEADQVKAISGYRDNIIHINATDALNNWEIVYEIPLHLKYFYEGKTETVRLETPVFPKSGYLFSRLSLEPVISLDSLTKSKYTILNSNSYYVSQIDPIAFRELFKMKPLQALQNPPLLKEGLDYYWEIRKL